MADRFLVSGWEDDLQDIQEEKHPHETPQKEILWAAENGELDIIKQLLDNDSTLVHVADDDGYTPLHRACYGNHIEVVNYLLQQGANVHAQSELKWQPLHSACQWNHNICVARLLENGADINAPTEGGQTPLHIAASHGASFETVQLLLMDPYIKPNIPSNNNGETARDIATRGSKYYNIFEIAEDLIQGLDINK